MVKEAIARGPGSDDHRLVQSILHGDAAAFDGLVKSHAQPVTSVVRRFLDDPNDLEDAVQETFLRAYRSLSRFRGQASLRTWLIQIALNVCRDRRRTFWMRRVVLAADSRSFEAATDDGRDLAERAAMQESIERAVRALPEKLRLPLVLHAFEELSGAEIAAVLGWSESTVWTRIYAARKRLHRELGSLLER